MSEPLNLTKRYDGCAVYTPSLQSQYAAFATKKNKDVRGGLLPNGFRVSDLNFLSPTSRLWTCGYALYSAGQFDKSSITSQDMIAERVPGESVIIGDSGGFQLGTGAIKSKSERKALYQHQLNPTAQYAAWPSVGYRERTLRWLDKYTDYAMTLDMALWTSEAANNPRAATSPFRKLSVQQLLDLSVDNLRYFSDNRGKWGSRQTKFLNVLQDIGGGTGEQWYQAVKDFDFEGWSLGGETGGYLASMRWLRRLLDDGKLEKTEWIHVLMKSPPIASVLYTAMQRALRAVTGRELTISYDSSSPHQSAGKQRALCKIPTLTSDLRTWTIANERIRQNINIAQRKELVQLPEGSPLRPFFTLNDLVVHQELYRDSFTDTLSEQLLVNHNIYVYHMAAINSCDVAFGGVGNAQLPSELADAISVIEQFFVTEKPDTLIQKNESLFAEL